MQPITSYHWDPKKVGSNPGVIMEQGFNIDTNKQQYICGFYADVDDTLEPDAYLKFDFCPKCGKALDA